MPDVLNQLCMYKPKLMYDLLFKTSWSVLNTFGNDHKWLGAQTGMISILHTWGPFNAWQFRTLNALRRCRTAALGGHIDGCSSFGNIRISYNSCRNRHCPKCQGTEREKWIQAREDELLPVPYFHVVFTP